LSAVPRLRPVTLREAKEAITRWHRHHHPRRGLRWAVGAELDDLLVGVAVVGNPSAPAFQRDPRILEVTRVAIDPATAPPPEHRQPPLRRLLASGQGPRLHPPGHLHPPR